MTDVIVQKPIGRSVPISDTITTIKGYPDKLKLYKIEASQFWQVRTYENGNWIKRSTKTESKTEAISFAKGFFEETVAKRSQSKSLTTVNTFYALSQNLLKDMESKVARGELTNDTFKNAKYRFAKKINPFFGAKKISDLYFDDLNDFLNALSLQKEPKLSNSTIGAYMKLVKQVFKYAVKRRSIDNIPPFPTVKYKHKPREPFTLNEYRRLWSRARSLTGKRFHYRVLQDALGSEVKGKYFKKDTETSGRLINTVEITRELVEVIIFMVNSYIRPNDITKIKHKHVDVVKKEYTYLRLSIPSSKNRETPIVTQTMAVKVYERLTEYNKSQGWGVEPNDFLFFPTYANRPSALKKLQQQFAALLSDLEIGSEKKGGEYALYSLRHTSIMFMLTYGGHIDVITMARNARTSQEMIDKFYGSRLSAEDNIDMIQSRRESKERRNKKILL